MSQPFDPSLRKPLATYLYVSLGDSVFGQKLEQRPRQWVTNGSLQQEKNWPRGSVPLTFLTASKCVIHVWCSVGNGDCVATVETGKLLSAFTLTLTLFSGTSFVSLTLIQERLFGMKLSRSGGTFNCIPVKASPGTTLACCLIAFILKTSCIPRKCVYIYILYISSGYVWKSGVFLEQGD